jgi:DNA-binding response OmpR family regulator
MLTSRSAKNDIIDGLDIGADDYMTKPFDYDELYARVKSLTRRNLENKSTTQIKYRDFVIDLKNSTVNKNGEDVHLSNLEFELLKYFSQNVGKIIDKKELYENVW